ncbi:hypothetical protein THOG11_130146 [Vibrio harveyi]|nr:hypothetical protein TH15OA1_250001 [Vibrio harveyi]CAH1550059.1 hypothetical protein THOD03_130148 [Vibrio harveyi]CAH1554340.1 hypothetical protein THOG11_130146 [Vibrio harveyi]
MIVLRLNIVKNIKLKFNKNGLILNNHSLDDVILWGAFYSRL